MITTLGQAARPAAIRTCSYMVRCSCTQTPAASHRVAISNHRLLDMQDGQVTFRYKDYKHAQQQKVMTLSADEFLRRFLLHVLPDGFQRIRHYGLLGNRHRAENLARCRELLAV